MDFMASLRPDEGWVESYTISMGVRPRPETRHEEGRAFQSAIGDAVGWLATEGFLIGNTGRYRLSPLGRDLCAAMREAAGELKGEELAAFKMFVAHVGSRTVDELGEAALRRDWFLLDAEDRQQFYERAQAVAQAWNEDGRDA
jgi:hypothetical protein